MPSTIEITGVQALERKIGSLRTLQVLAQPMVRSMARIVSKVATYPARPASNRKNPYRRTGLFGRSWQMRVNSTGGSLEGIVDNPTPYGPYVMGPGPDKPMQAWMHVGIWRTTDQWVEEVADDIVADFTATINRELAK